MKVQSILCHYKALNHLKKAISSFREFYPKQPLIVIDGSGFDGSSDWLYKKAKKDKNMTVFHFHYNVHHGPSMHKGLLVSEEEHNFIFESDVVITGKILDTFLKEVEGKEYHSIGPLRFLKKNECAKGNEKCWYVHPHCMMVHRPTYLKYKPFIIHGAPCIETALDLKHKGQEKLLLKLPDINEFRTHTWGGTRKKHGINLEWQKGKAGVRK